MEHRPEQAPSQVTLRQQEPVVARVRDQPPTRLDEALLGLVNDQLSTRFGSTSRRQRFPRL